MHVLCGGKFAAVPISGKASYMLITQSEILPGCPLCHACAGAWVVGLIITN